MRSPLLRSALPDARRLSGARPLRLLVAAAAGLAAAAAPAGVPLRTPAGAPIRWALDIDQPNVLDGKVTWYIEPGASEEEPPGTDTEADAVRAAFDTWTSSPGTVIRAAEDQTRWAYKTTGADRVNFLAWRVQTLGPLTLAATYLTQRSGELADADVVFNDTKDFVVWSTDTPGIPGYADIHAIAAHEIGHFLGLDHSPLGPSTMYPTIPVGSIHARSLEPDDVGAIADAYPGPPDGSRGLIAGTAFVGRRTAKRGLPVFALDARTGQVQAGTFTDDQGRWRIRSLAPGPYIVAAAPLAATAPYSTWWKRSPTRVEPAFIEREPGVPAVVQVQASVQATGLTLVAGRAGRRERAEPDEALSSARPLAAGSAAAGRFDAPGDADWFRLAGTPGTIVDLRVRAWALGSTADPELAVLHSGGVLVLRSQRDRRPAEDPAFAQGPLGPDPDCDIEGVVLPADGSVLVRVTAEQGSGSGGPDAFYLLTASYAAGVPDPAATGARVEPAAVRASSGGVVAVIASPLDHAGAPLPAGATVAAYPSDGGPVVALEPGPDGSFRGETPVPAVPGIVSFELRIATASGPATVPGAATLSVADAAVVHEGEFTASPRRIEADGVAKATLRFVPRDGAGRALGGGAAVGYAFEGAASGTLAQPKDFGDGRYEVSLVAPTLPGRAVVGAAVDGVPAAGSVRVGFGWDFAAVLEDLEVSIDILAGSPGLPRSWEIALAGAAPQLSFSRELLVAHEIEDAAAAASKAARALRRFARDATATEVASGVADLAEAVRRRLDSRLGAINAALLAPTERVAYDRARALLRAGAARQARGDAAGAVARFARGLARSRGLS